MADQLPDWFTGGYGWDPSRLGEADTNTKYAIANYAIQNHLDLNNPNRDVAAQIFNALKARFPQLSLVNPDTIDLGNGDGTIGVRPNDRNSNWDARQGPWNLSWIDPYHSNSQSNSAQAVAGTAKPNVLPPGYQFPNTGIGGYGPGGTDVPPVIPQTPAPWSPPNDWPGGEPIPSPSPSYPTPNDPKSPTDYPDQQSPYPKPTDQKNPNEPDIENIVQRALSRVMI